MSTPPNDERTPPVLDCAALAALAHAAHTHAPCPRCATLQRPGWESLSSTFERASWRRVATLVQPDDGSGDEPTLSEYHPNGTHSWSPDAPIAARWFPYNRCEVWGCVDCGRAYLRYTEYGGYYEEERVRWLDVGVVVAC